jgi:protein-L-isoaspartate(D-aspartate) O-methyltransferase
MGSVDLRFAGCLLALLWACGGQRAQIEAGERTEEAQERARMLENQLIPRGITDDRVLAAMGMVPRHLFVPSSQSSSAYEDHPLPIGQGQTISQPYIVAFMTQALQLRGGEKVLEIGTGSGYQAAVLAEIADEVYTIEIVAALSEEARARLERLGYRNIHVRTGDGYRGWPEAAPFDAILVTAAPDHVPKALVEQLAPNGRMILPVGDLEQSLILIEKDGQGNVHEREVLPVRFVPMTGEAQQPPVNSR